MSLSPEEKRYYGQLFKAADSERLGVITGEVAVKFFEKSGLPAATLGQIWEISDKDNSGYLTQQSFSVALRLIGQAQSGRTPEAALAKTPGQFPRFEGIDAPGAPAPGRAAAPQPPKARNIVPALTPEDRAKYFNTWLSVCPSNDSLDGERARDVFQKANLPVEQLGQIWALTDTRQRGALDSTEFVVAMHLIQSMMNGSIKSPPTSLPPALFEAAAKGPPGPSARSQRQQSSVSSNRSQEIPPQQMPSQRQPVPIRSQLTGPPGRNSPSLAQAAQIQPQMSGQVQNADWDVKPHEKANYDHLFSDIDKSGKGFITGEEAVGFFMQSKLPEEDLAQVWDLSDMDNSGRLTKELFAVAMHLIKAKLGGKDLPGKLPFSLIPPAMRSQVQSPSVPLFGDPSAQAQARAPPPPSSAAADLFGLNDSFSAPPPSQSPPAQAFTNNYGAIDRLASPPASDLSALRALPQTKPTPAPARGFGGQPAFVPSSSFGQSIQQQQQPPAAQVVQSVQPPAQQFQQPRQMEQDLLSDADPHESRNISSESTEVANLNNQMGSLTTQHQQVMQERSQTERDIGNMQGQKTELAARLVQIRQAYDEEVKVVRAMQNEQGKLRQENRDLLKEVSLLEASLEAVKQQHSQLSAQFESDKTDNAAIKERIRSANDQTATLKATLEKVQKDAKQQRGLVAINTKQLNTLEAEHERINALIEEEARTHEEHKAIAQQQEKQRAEREQNIAALERERASANEEQRRSALISPALSTASVSTNPFHRTSTPGGATPRPRGAIPGFPTGSDSSSGPSFPFVKTAVAGAALAGVGSGAAAVAFGHQDGSDRQRVPQTIDTDDRSSTYATAPTTADSSFPRSALMSNFDHAFAPASQEHANQSTPSGLSQPPAFSEEMTSQETQKDTTPSVFQTNEHNAPEFANEAGSAPHDTPATGEQHTRSTQLVTPQAQGWSDADPFTADTRVASPGIAESRPAPAAVANLILSSSASDNGSVATSVRAFAPASVRDGNQESRPMTPASMIWGSDANNTPQVGSNSREMESATEEHELAQPTDAETVQQTLSRPPTDNMTDNMTTAYTPASDSSSPVAPQVPGAFPSETSQVPGAFPADEAQPIPTADKGKAPAEPASIHANSSFDPFGSFAARSPQPDIPSYESSRGFGGPDVSVAAETTEVDSSDDEEIEKPRGADMFSHTSHASQSVDSVDSETESNHTVTEEPQGSNSLNTFSAFGSGTSSSNNTEGHAFSQQTTSKAPATAPTSKDDEFDEFDDLEEATEADEDDDPETSFTTQDLTFDAPSARSSVNAPVASYGRISTPIDLSRPVQNGSQNSPVRDFSEFSHYSSVIAEPQGLAPAITYDTSSVQTTNYSNNASSYSSYSQPPVQASTQIFNSQSQPNSAMQVSSPAPAPPASRHGATLAPKRPEPARQISAADDPMLQELTDMGFDRAKSVSALEKFNYDLGAATDWLLKGN